VTVKSFTPGSDCSTASITSDPSALSFASSQNPVTAALGASVCRSAVDSTTGSSPSAITALTSSEVAPTFSVTESPSSIPIVFIASGPISAVPGFSWEMSVLRATVRAASGSMPLTWISCCPAWATTPRTGTA
jgi:hypothetical protein